MSTSNAALKQSIAGLDTQIEPGEHVIAAFTRKRQGPTLIVLGGLHGNEPTGVKAMFNLAPALASLEDRLKGRVYLIAGNTRALQEGVRFIDHDLNRAWSPDGIQRAATRSNDVENRELMELDELLDTILVTAEDEVYVVDLHSTSAGGYPFATVGDTLRNRHFARKFPVRILLGIEEQLDGTLLEYLNNAGAVTLGFEGGQHTAMATIENHAALIWVALVNSGILDEKDVADIELHKLHLGAGASHRRIIEVRRRQPVAEDDGFVMLPGFNNFDPIEEGQPLADSRRGQIRSPEQGMVLMPLYQKLGEDGFFIARYVSSFWLVLSEVVRRLGIPDLVHWLPGVSRDPLDPMTLTVNTSVARLFPLQIFHLLGFRKRRWVNKKLVVSRRRHDAVSPFAAEKNGR